MNKIINQGRVALMNQARKDPKFVKSYETAVIQQYNDNRVEVMMLFMAEVLHDELGFGEKRTRKILRGVDDRMVEFVNEGFDMDKLRVRVFEKTGFMFACSDEDEKHICEVLEAAGYAVRKEVPGGDSRSN